jgi:cyclin D3
VVNVTILSDSRVMMSYLPSTLAAATMIHVIKEIEPFNSTEYIDQLMSLLKIVRFVLLIWLFFSPLHCQ